MAGRFVLAKTPDGDARRRRNRCEKRDAVAGGRTPQLPTIGVEERLGASLRPQQLRTRRDDRKPDIEQVPPTSLRDPSRRIPRRPHSYNVPAFSFVADSEGAHHLTGDWRLETTDYSIVRGLLHAVDH